MLASSAKVNGVIVAIIVFSLPLAQKLAALEVPQGFVQLMTSMTDSEPMLILIMIGILILAGCVMETTPNIVILAPILLPLAQEIGMDEIHFCIMMVTALGVGFITPPLGLSLFVVSGLTGTPILKSQARPYPTSSPCSAWFCSSLSCPSCHCGQSVDDSREPSFRQPQMCEQKP